MLSKICCHPSGTTLLRRKAPYSKRMRRLIYDIEDYQSRSQRPRSFWLATGIATSGQVQLRRSAIHGPPITLRMHRAESDKSDWLWSQPIVFTQPFKTGMSLSLARGPDISSAWQEGPLGTRLDDYILGQRYIRNYTRTASTLPCSGMNITRGTHAL